MGALAKLPLLAMAAAALIAVGGCGDGGAQQDYADEVQTVLEPLGGELERIGDIVSESDNPRELADSVQAAEDEIRSAVEKLRGIEPPSEVEDAHTDLIAGLEDFNAALRRLSDAAERGETSEILSAATALPGAVTDFQERVESVKQQLEDAGIEVSG